VLWFCIVALPALAWGATPLLEWRMDDVGWNGVPNVVTNAAGNRFHGTWVNPAANPPALTPVITGTPGTCGYGQFTATSYVDGSNPDLGLTDQLTVMAWVRWERQPGTGTPRAVILSNNSASVANDGQFWLQHTNDNSRYEFVVKTPDGTRTVTAHAGPAPVAGQWQHVAGVYDGASLRIYVNGVASWSVIHTGRLPYQEDYRLQVGRWAHNSEALRAFHGAIDEVRIYAAALSAAEVQQAMQARRGCGTGFTAYQAPVPKPVLDVRMDERLWRGTTEKVLDSSSNKFHGLAMNGATPALDTPALPGTSGTCGYGAFDGGNQYVNFGPVPLGLTGQVTVMAWIRWGIEPQTGHAWANVVTNNRTSRADQGQFWLQHNNANSRFEFVVQTDDGKQRVLSTTPPIPGVWYHVAGVYDGRNLMLFVNGQLENLNSHAGTFLTQTDYQLTVARWAHSSQNYRAFRGNIDEVRIYREGLSAAMIARLAAITHTCSNTTLATPPQLEIASHTSGMGVLPDGFSLSGTVSDAGNDLAGLVITIDDPVLGRTVNQQLVSVQPQTGVWTFVVSPQLVSPGKLVTITLTATDTDGITTTRTLQVQVVPRPAALWHLDAVPAWSGATGEVADASGSQFHGRAVNGASNRTTSPVLPGDDGTCGYGKFNGTDQYLDLGNPNFGFGKRLTVMAWVRWAVDPLTGKPRATIITNNRATESDKGQFWLHHKVDNSGFAFAVQTDLGRQEVRSTTPLQAGVWYHVAGVYDSSTLRLLVNGVEESSTAQSGSVVFDPEGQLTIGRSAHFGSGYRALRGDIDEVQVYREALSTAQILALIAAGHRCNPDAASVSPVLTIASHHNEDGVTPGGFTLSGLLSDQGAPVQAFVDVDDPLLGRTVEQREVSRNAAGQWTLVVAGHEVSPNRKITVTVRALDSSGQETRLLLQLQVAPLPQALWHFESLQQWQGNAGEVVDASGRGYVGQALYGAHILYDTPAFGDSIAGTCGYATFERANQYIDLGTPDLRLTNQLTVMAWVKWDIDPSTGNTRTTLVSNDSSSTVNTGQFWLRHNADNSYFAFAVQTSVGFLEVTSVTQPQPGVWYHLAGVYDGSLLSLYVNGVDENRRPHSGTFTYNPAYRLQFGRSSLANNNYRAFSGGLDEVQVYKSALTAKVIRAVAYAPRACPAAPALMVEEHLESVVQSDGLRLSGSATSGYTLTEVQVRLFDAVSGQLLGQYLAELTPEGYWSVLVDGALLAPEQTLNVAVIVADITGQSMQRVFMVNTDGSAGNNEPVLTYGPINESCSSSGIPVPVGADLTALVAASRAGDTFLLRAGTHFLTQHVRFPAGTASLPVTLKSYNCEDVVLSTQGFSLYPDDYTVIAGLRIVTNALTVNAIVVEEPTADARHGIVIRNNTLSGSASQNQIRLVGNVQSALISGNDISHLSSSLITLRLAESSTYYPHNTRIVRNYIHHCGEDCFQPQRAGTFVVEDNVFEAARENLVDVKGLRKNSFLRRNTFHCTTSSTACLLLQWSSAAGAEGTIEGNHFIGCPAGASPQVRATRAGAHGTYHFRYNTFEPDGTSCVALGINTCDNCDIAHNTFYRGEIAIGADGWPTNNTIRNNIFYQTLIDDKTDGSVYTCSTNGLYDVPQGFRASCAASVVTNPRFVSPTVGDFHVQSPDYLGTASDGGNIGAW
jgi:hypothetical protein